MERHLMHDIQISSVGIKISIVVLKGIKQNVISASLLAIADIVYVRTCAGFIDSLQRS